MCQDIFIFLMIEDVRIGFVAGNLSSRAFYCHLTNIEFLIDAIPKDLHARSESME